jgi:hypothetical protein
MTSFVHVDQPTEHPGVARAERAFATIGSIARAIRRSLSAATLLLAAMVSALLVLANQVIETWTDGHLLVAWIALWTVAFAALALLAAPASRLVRRLRAGWARRVAARSQAAQDDALWEIALSDARMMADISRAMAADGERHQRA